MDKFLDTYTIPWLNQEENQIRPITSNKINSVINSLPSKKSPIWPYYWILPFTKQLIQSPLRCPKKVRERNSSNKFYKVSITLIPKPNEDTKESENCRPISFMNINAKMPNKILANWIQQHTTKIIYSDQCKNSLIHTNQ
jgi:hypothetical protein